MSAAGVAKIMELLSREYPDAKIELAHTTPFELLIATILSAQCTDERVNRVTANLFRKYRTPLDYVRASTEELENDIRSTGFYRNKARNIKKACELLISDFNSQVPGRMEDLLRLPGVARKTANVVLTAFGVAEGIVVDTHVSRVSQRLGLTAHKKPEDIEKDLMDALPGDKREQFSLMMIRHGRYVCTARHPKCDKCVLNRICPSAFKFT